MHIISLARCSAADFDIYGPRRSVAAGQRPGQHHPRSQAAHPANMSATDVSGSPEHAKEIQSSK